MNCRDCVYLKKWHKITSFFSGEFQVKCSLTPNEKKTFSDDISRDVWEVVNELLQPDCPLKETECPICEFIHQYHIPYESAICCEDKHEAQIIPWEHLENIEHELMGITLLKELYKKCPKVKK